VTTKHRAASLVGIARPDPVALTRCAVYTRKSTTEGLESDFNSLDAQREACEAYVTSQRLEGWVLVGERYDDGGFTGGNMDRPALTQLLTDIRGGRVDCVIVYKVDRLSRSLLDFARLMEVFDLHQVAFVSVTQQFNTATSMGRLVLNVLLSFAQFEREIISERTADKMGAARRKGKLLGATPILGYNRAQDPVRLVLNAEEVVMVKAIFSLYLEMRSMLEVAKEVNSRGWPTKTHTCKNGRTRAGHAFSKTDVQRILTNVTYTGQIDYKGEVVRGEQPAIIDEATFHAVQKLIVANRHVGGRERRHQHIALLKKLLVCGKCGAAMGHTYAKKGSRLYRYYLCTTRHKRGEESCDAPPLPAQQIEDCVVALIQQIGLDPDLRDQALAQTLQQREDRRVKLRDEQSRVAQRQQGIEERVHRLIATIEASASPPASLLERLHTEETKLRSAKSILAEVDTQLASLDAETVDGERLIEGLSRFDLLWSSLVEKERILLLHQIVDRATYDPRSQDVAIRFRLAVASE